MCLGSRHVDLKGAVSHLLHGMASVPATSSLREILQQKMPI